MKEVDLKKEFNEYFFNFTDPETGEKLKRKECWLDIKQARKFAKHFFELGLKAQQNIIIDVTNIDKIIEENGVDPNSKEAKIFKESYYMALEKLKVQKGE